MDMENSLDKGHGVNYSYRRDREMIIQQMLDLMMKWEEEDVHVNSWERSLLPHDEYYFPCSLPRSSLTELKQDLGVLPSMHDDNPDEDGSEDYHHRMLERHNGCVVSSATPTEQPPSSIEEGGTFDLEHCLVDNDDIDEGHQYLVRKDGTTHVRVDSLRNKHVLLCCFCVPLYWALNAVSVARVISSLCTELAALKEKGEECEMVIVAKMPSHWSDNKAAFDHFFKAFPDSCLTVPFHQKKRIDRICQSLDLRSFYPHSLFISPDRKVLRMGVERFWSYGVEDGYPFSNERLRAVEERDKQLLSGSCTRPLATLLGGWDPLPSEHRLRDVLTGEERISISELEKMDVGVYLCCKGDLLDRLSEVYHHCKKKERGFEVVVVWFPDVTGLGKSELEHLMTDAFKLRGLTFLALPFDNSVAARTLVRVSGDKLDYMMGDRLLTVGANGTFVDPIADVIMRLWDIDYAYPFSLAFLIDKEVERLRSVELDSILGKINSALLVVGKNPSQISVEELKARLKGKRVYVYHMAVDKPYPEEFDPWSWCKEFKAKYPDCEVLYVQSREMDRDSWYFVDGLSLFMCPFDSSLSKFVNTITSVAGTNTLESVGFGQDGRVVSLGARVDPFVDTLREDIRSKLVSFIDGEREEDNCHALLFRPGGFIGPA